MDKQTVGMMRVAINKALDTVKVASKEYLDNDLKLYVGNISYSDTGFKASIICEEVNKDGTNNRWDADWKQAVQLGIVKAEWLGVITGHGAKQMKVVGYDFNRPKNCVILKNLRTGKTFVTTKRHFSSIQFSTPAPLLDDADRGEKVLNIKDLAQEVNRA